MHSWQHCIDRHLVHQIYRDKRMIHTNTWFGLQHPNERRAAAKGDYTELIIRVKKEYATYLKFVEVPEVKRPERMNMLERRK